MSLTYEVPVSVQRASQRALSLHQGNALADVSGVALAEQLISGRCTIEHVARVYRFHETNTRLVMAESQLMHTAQDSPLVRSFELHGAEAGQRWAAKIIRAAVSEGYELRDSTTSLLKLTPDEIYDAFSLGAWRFEYDLTPQKAARFLEHYHRASGWNLDMRRAFGESAGAVGNALYRRLHGPDPFQEAARAMEVRDAEYRLAAELDLTDLSEGLDESMSKQTFQGANAKLSAKMVWPAFVAYVILAVERPELLVDLNMESHKPPPPHQSAKTWTAYHDAINTYLAYFHTDGARFHDPVDEKGFGQLLDDVHNLLFKAYFGKKVQAVWAQKLLGRMRRWTAQNKLAGSLFHVYNADWKKGNWAHILDAIPPDADVRPYFAEFAAINPMPLDGVKLQQTLSNKKEKVEVLKFLAMKTHGKPGDVPPSAYKIDDSQTGKWLKVNMGTPLGVYSVVRLGPGGSEVYCLGAWRLPVSHTIAFCMRYKSGALAFWADSDLKQNFMADGYSVTHAHKDMPGTLYGAVYPENPTPTTQTADGGGTGADVDVDADVSADDSGTVVLPKTVDGLPSDLYAVLKDNLTSAALASVQVVSFSATSLYQEVNLVGKFAGTVVKDALWTMTGPSSVSTYRLAVAFRYSPAFGDPDIVMIAMTGPLHESTENLYLYVRDSKLVDKFLKGAFAPKLDAALPEMPKPPTKDFDAESLGVPSQFTAFADEFASYLTKGTPEFELAVMSLSNTKTGEAFKQSYFKSLSSEELLTATASQATVVVDTYFPNTEIGISLGTEFQVGSALQDVDAGTVWILGRFLQGGEYYAVLDTELAHFLKGKALVPLWAKGALTSADVSDPPEPSEEVLEPFSFKTGDVIKWSGSTYVVLGDDGIFYALQVTSMDGVPKLYEAAAINKEAKLVESLPFGPLSAWKHTEPPLGFIKDASPPGSFVVGEFIQDSETYTVVGGMSDEVGVSYLVRAAAQLITLGGHQYDMWVLSFKSLFQLGVQESSYAPPAEVPENPHESDEPDPEQGNLEMSGTQEAFDWLEKKGWSPATYSESPGLFAYQLGHVRAYKSESTRTIIGYGIRVPKLYEAAEIYVIKTEKGNVNWVTCVNAHKKYGGLIESHKVTVAHLLPKPGSEAIEAKYPRLNYTLSRLGKKVADTHDFTYAERPSEPTKPVFHVNTPLISTVSLTKYELVGYVQKAASDGLSSETLAVLAVVEGWEDATVVGVVSVAVSHLNSAYRTYYSELTVSDFSTGEHAWGKEKGEPGISLTLPTGYVPSIEPAGWDEPTPIKQPVFGELSEDQHASAGVLVIVPPGTGVSGPIGVGMTKFPSIVCYDPIGRFGGYKLCLPKGSLEEGESVVKAAVREVWEETGLTVKPVAHLGDYRANTSLNRFFIGYVTGGNPKKKVVPDESMIVRMFPLTTDKSGAPTFQESKWFKDLVPKSGAKWQQKVVMNAWQWVQENGMPHAVKVDAADYDVAVTGPEDTAVELGDPVLDLLEAPDPYSEAAFAQDPSDLSAPPEVAQHVAFKPSIPADSYGSNIWKALYFKCPFPVTDAMVAQFKSKVKSGDASDPVGFDASRDRADGPNFGEAFETSAGTPYTAAGYVSWMGVDANAYHFLLVWTPAGSVEAIVCGPDGVPGSHVLSDQTSMQQDLDAWFQHDNPETNAVIQSVYEKGTLPKGVTMAVFKTKWCKQAGVPAYAVITKPVLRDVASMFVPGACSQQQHDAIVSSLKARMAQTHKKSKGTTPVLTNTSSAAPSSPSTPILLTTKPKKVMPPAHFESPLYTQYVDNPQPFLFAATGKKMSGGSKPNTILTGPGGKQWFAKWHSSEKFRAEFDHAGYQFSQLCKGNNVPIGVMDLDVNGTTRHLSFQPVVENAGYPPLDPRELNGDNQAELLSQHAADCFMGDHDGHAANWLMQKNGQITAVDRGQAMKFIWMGTEESLDPFWKAPGNIPQLGNEQSYAKHLLKLWAQGKAEIPEVAWAEMRKTITKVMAISDAQIGAIVQPVGEAMGKTVSEMAKVIETFRKRRDAYLKNWTSTLKKLRKDFKWPAAAGTGADLNLPTNAFQSSPEALGFGKREESTIKEAVAAGWQGKSLKIDKDAIEGQEVLCQRVMYQEKPGVNVPATMISFRVARPAGLDATVKAVKNKDLAVGVDLSGPHRLKVDQTNTIFEKIWAAIKSVNHHLGNLKDLDINMGTISAMNALEPTLQTLVKSAENASGAYTPTGEPNEAVYAMAEQYLQYLGVVNYWVENKEDLLGQHSPKLVEFLWEDPPEEEETNKPKPSYKVVMKKTGALWPTVNPVDQKNLTVTNLNKPVMNSGQQSQFIVEDPVTKARVFFNPPGGLTSVMGHEAVGKLGLQSGVESHKGQCWALIPGEPSSATVAHLLALVQDAFGIDTSASTPEDEEVLYWSRQVSLLQGNGVVKPEADHTSVKEMPYKEAMGKYHGGDAKGAVADLQKVAAGKLGMSVEEVRKLGTSTEVAGHYTRGAGRIRHHRIGWTRDRLLKEMGKSCHVAHSISDDTVTWMKHMSLNGALISNSTKPYFGVTKLGGSPGADVLRGGGQGLFACFRKGFVSTAGMTYFDISLALRTDVYIVGTGDTYGDTGLVRYTTPEQWVGMGAHLKKGTCGASSSQQINLRHDIDLQQYLVRVVCESAPAREKCIAIANGLGWTFYGGAKPEKVFVS